MKKEDTQTSAFNAKIIVSRAQKNHVSSSNSASKEGYPCKVFKCDDSNIPDDFNQFEEWHDTANESGKPVIDSTKSNQRFRPVDAQEKEINWHELLKLLEKADPRFFVIYSHLREQIDGEFVFASKRSHDKVMRETPNIEVITATKDNFEFVGLAFFGIDMDECPPEEIDNYQQIILNMIPRGNEATRITLPSSSSNIYRPNGVNYSGETGRRIILAIDKQEHIVECMKIIFERLVLARHARLKIATNGKPSRRSLIDLAVYRETQPDYIGGCILPDGWTQKRRDNIKFIQGNIEFIKADDILKMRLTKKEQAQVDAIFKDIIAENTDEMKRIRAEYLAKMTPEQRKKYEEYEQIDAIPLDWKWQIFGDDDDTILSVQEMIADFETYSKTYFRDPFDTDSKSNRCILRKDAKGYFIQVFGRGNLRIANGDWRDKLAKDAKGEVRWPSHINRDIYFENMLLGSGKSLKFNEFSQRQEYQGRNMSDAETFQLMPEFEQFTDGKMLSADAVRMSVSNISSKNSYHPVRDYLENLVWDGTPRLNTWLNNYANVKQTEVVEMISRMFMISMVARVYKPGCKVDTTLMLYQANGGAGKSGMAKILAGGSNHFLVLAADLERKQQAANEQLSGKWIVELSEMKSVRKASIETVKEFLTTDTDTYRAAYGRNSNDYPRQCVFIATTNKKELPDDPALIRRFLPVEVNSIFDDEYDKKHKKVKFAELERDRDQLLAEAVFAFKSGEAWHLAEGDKRIDMLIEHQREFVAVDHDVEFLTEVLAGADWKDKERIRVADLREIFDIKTSDSSRKFKISDAKSAMNKVSGWEYRGKIKGYETWGRIKETDDAVPLIFRDKAA